MEDIRDLINAKNEEIKSEDADAKAIELTPEAEAKIKQAWIDEKVSDEETF